MLELISQLGKWIIEDWSSEQWFEVRLLAIHVCLLCCSTCFPACWKDGKRGIESVGIYYDQKLYQRCTKNASVCLLSDFIC